MSAAKELLRRTAQLEKFRAGFSVVALGGVVVFASGFLIGFLSTQQFFLISTAGLAIGVAGLVYLTRTIKCPKCSALWVWLLASKRRGDSAHWSFRSDSCPLCGFSGRG